MEFRDHSFENKLKRLWAKGQAVSNFPFPVGLVLSCCVLHPVCSSALLLQERRRASPSCRRLPTAWRPIGCAWPSPVARLCTGAWSDVRPTPLSSLWGSKWPTSAWRGRRLFCPDTLHWPPASASEASGERSSVCASTGGFACSQVSLSVRLSVSQCVSLNSLDIFHFDFHWNI